VKEYDIEYFQIDMNIIGCLWNYSIWKL